MRDDDDNPMMQSAITHYDELASFVARKVGSVSLAADIVQETCLRLLSGSKPELEAIRNPRAYLFRMVNNLIVDRLRQETSRNRVIVSAPPPEDAADHGPNSERIVANRQRLALLMQAIDTLPPRCREVFVLRRFEDLSQDEIAQRLHISRSMVDKHLRQALLLCARWLEERE